MPQWTQTELNRIGAAEELQIAGLRADGSLRKRVIIWVVRIGDDLYVRSVNGRTSGWFRGIQVRHAGRIWAGGVEKDVEFVEVNEPEIIAEVDDAYRAKYRRYSQWVAPMLVPDARAATLKLIPRPSEA